MRKLTLPVMLLLAGAFALPCAAESEQSLELLMADGSVRHVRLSEQPRISLTDKQVSISCGDNIIEIPRAEMKSYTIGTHDFAGVGTLTAETAIELRGLGVTVGGLKPGTAAYLYTLDGRTATTAIADTDGRLSLSAPASGAYILLAGKMNMKLLLK